ncbi:PASTA domain-containing protein [Nocardia sp. alder85J]|uniref:PASTA domain-containing protein n=1 Tax=Nocardia sp. alder85J TaxID=2862949 RepID=UPI001CD55BDA|nr:PASTA domain-containing protein [Nocardia sp. alder85J]MCX4095450.1 PASTA domain-containing protein [Nocardia sp. alder85J]
MADNSRWGEGGAAWKRLTGRRAGPGTGAEALAALDEVVTVRRALDQLELHAVRAARQHGQSWTEIATYLGVTRQSAWERWRDLDQTLATEQAAREAVGAVAGSARERRRSATVTVPGVIGKSWADARIALEKVGLAAVSAEAGTPTPDPAETGWIVTDQSPEAGAKVPPRSIVQLWLRRDDGPGGVREPRRPGPTPRSMRAALPEPSGESVG